MRAKKKIFYAAAVLSTFISLFVGCAPPEEIAEALVAPVMTPTMPPSSETIKRFESGNSSSPTAVESAIELSKQVAELSEQIVSLKQEKMTLLGENARLKEQLSEMEPELAQTKTELTQANALLIEMRIELNNWKSDVLGYRDEMREASRAQLEMLLKIAEALGAQSVAEAEQMQSESAVASAASSSN